MAVRQPFWKCWRWKPIGFYPYTQVLRYWSLELIFKTKVNPEPGNHQIHLQITSLKISRFLPMATINMHMKFGIEISRQTWPSPRKPWYVAFRRTDGRTDRRTRWIQSTPSNLVWRGYNKELKQQMFHIYCDPFMHRSWIRNYTHLQLWNAIINLCPNFNGGLAKPPLKFVHGWTITSHKTWCVITYPCFRFMHTHSVEYAPTHDILWSGLRVTGTRMG